MPRRPPVKPWPILLALFAGVGLFFAHDAARRAQALEGDVERFQTRLKRETLDRGRSGLGAAERTALAAKARRLGLTDSGLLAAPFSARLELDLPKAQAALTDLCTGKIVENLEIRRLDSGLVSIQASGLALSRRDSAAHKPESERP